MHEQTRMLYLQQLQQSDVLLGLVEKSLVKTVFWAVLLMFFTVKSNLMRQMSVATGQMVYLQGLVKVVTEA